MEKYINRDEKRRVLETINALLRPMMPYLNNDIAIAVNRAMYLLGEIDITDEVESEEL